MAQFVMIDPILIAERHAVDALSDQGRDLMLDRFGRPVIHKQPANRPTKSIARSVAPSSIAPPSEVILPPSNAAITSAPRRVQSQTDRGYTLSASGHSY
jgi:hypothetical protein